MAKGRVLLAALAGLLVSFLVFAALTMLTPDPDLHHGEGDVVWQRFQFQEGRYEFTRTSVATVVNQDPVPVNLVVTGPGGGNVSFVLSANATAEIDLDEQGVYRLTAEPYRWGEVEILVRSDNPFVRFFEDVF
jgi:hypothetical protein